jgi:hypothetical protein
MALVQANQTRTSHRCGTIHIVPKMRKNNVLFSKPQFQVQEIMFHQKLLYPYIENKNSSVG